MAVVMPRPGGPRGGVKVHGGPSGTACAAGGVTLGVEEEFVFLDPATGAPVLAAPDLVAMLGGEPGVQQELMRFQVEIATGVCTGLDCAGRELARLRRLVAPAPWVGAALTAAARHGLAWAGVDPFTGQTADPRSLLSRLLDHVCPALSDRGDSQTITGLLRQLSDRGTGADRQRAFFATAGSVPGFVEALARATLSRDELAYGCQPNARSERPPGAWTPCPADGAQTLMPSGR
jgi:gamma-glutamyl:cysteine ligase YbdK (ATP-grasp superfamily)